MTQEEMKTDSNPKELLDSSQNLTHQADLTFEDLKIGTKVEFKLHGVHESFVKMNGIFMGIENQTAVFSSLEGIFNVKQKFHFNTPILVIGGNFTFLTKILLLKGNQLFLSDPPIKVIPNEDKRCEPRYNCKINASIQFAHRGVSRSDKAIVIENISLHGCRISMELSREDWSTGLSVGKSISIFIDMPIQKHRIEFKGVVRNVQKQNPLTKHAGIEFADLSTEASMALCGICNKLESIHNINAQ